MISSPWKGDRFAPWLLVLLVVAIYLPGTAQLPLLDRDEPRFATATREMKDAQNWIVPTFNGSDRFDKPVLVYWLMRGGYATVGVGEFGARLPALVCMMGLVLLVWWTGKRWFGGREGFFAGFMLATSLQFFIHGRLAVADLPMVLCVAVTCVALGELLVTPNGTMAASARPPWTHVAWWSLWLALGLGFLAKGPIALAVPALALVLWRWVFLRKPMAWARLGIIRGLCLATGIIAIWGIPALWVTHGAFWKIGMGEHVIRRGFEPFNGRSYYGLFYLGTAFLSLFPWIIFAGVAGLAVRREWEARRAWLASWLLAPYLIFSVYATQLSHYVLPGFPAFFLLLGTGLRPTGWTALGRWQKWVGVGVLSLFGLGVIVFAALVARAELPAGVEPLRQSVFGLLAVYGGFLLVATAWWGRWIGVGVLGVVLLGTGGYVTATGLRAVNPAVTISASLHDLPSDTRYMGLGFSEPSLVFYSGVKWDFLSTPSALTEAFVKPGPVLTVVMESECDPLGFFTGRLNWRDQPVPPGLTETAQRIQTLEAFNPGRSRWQRISVWLRPVSPEPQSVSPDR